jgi:hypothetical protein
VSIPCAPGSLPPTPQGIMPTREVGSGYPQHPLGEIGSSCADISLPPARTAPDRFAQREADELTSQPNVFVERITVDTGTVADLARRRVPSTEGPATSAVPLAPGRGRSKTLRSAHNLARRGPGWCSRCGTCPADRRGMSLMRYSPRSGPSARGWCGSSGMTAGGRWCASGRTRRTIPRSPRSRSWPPGARPPRPRRRTCRHREASRWRRSGGDQVRAAPFFRMASSKRATGRRGWRLQLRAARLRQVTSMPRGEVTTAPTTGAGRVWSTTTPNKGNGIARRYGGGASIDMPDSTRTKNIPTANAQSDRVICVCFRRAAAQFWEDFDSSTASSCCDVCVMAAITAATMKAATAIHSTMPNAGRMKKGSRSLSLSSTRAAPASAKLAASEAIAATPAAR